MLLPEFPVCTTKRNGSISGLRQQQAFLGSLLGGFKNNPSFTPTFTLNLSPNLGGSLRGSKGGSNLPIQQLPNARPCQVLCAGLRLPFSSD